MRYTKPELLRTDDAVLAIQHQDSTDPNKLSDQYNDTIKSCTQFAYEADE